MEAEEAGYGEGLPKYTEPDAVKFVEDMERHGFEVEHYHGRSYWRGPAVRSDESGLDGPSLQDIIRATTVTVQWDNMGYDWIVYPVHGDSGE